MRKLNLFLKFDFVGWQNGKEFMIQNVKYNEKRACVSLDVIITEDKTDYGDPTISNIFEKFKVHCIFCSSAMATSCHPSPAPRIAWEHL